MLFPVPLPFCWHPCLFSCFGGTLDFGGDEEGEDFIGFPEA